jgi:hypothetical protein
VNLNTILRSVADAAKPAVSDGHADLITDLSGDYTPVRGDGRRSRVRFCASACVSSRSDEAGIFRQPTCRYPRKSRAAQGPVTITWIRSRTKAASPSNAGSNR